MGNCQSSGRVVARLWAPWRMEYVSSPGDRSTIFEDKIASDDDRDALILYRGKLSVVIMNLYPYNNGHLLVLPTRKVERMEDLSDDEMAEIMRLSKRSMSIIRQKMSADGFNLGLNIGKAAGAGIGEHIHFHIVPRWSGDNNFMPAVGNTKVMVQGLEDTYDLLLPEFEKID